MPLLVQAWRNLWRNRGRSLLTGAVMAFAVAVMILFLGVGDGSHARLIRGPRTPGSATCRCGTRPGRRTPGWRR